MGDFTRLADLLLTNDLDTALRLLDRQASIGGGGGFLGLGIWRYRTETTSTPNSGQLQFDDTTIGDATELYVHAVNDSGADMSAFLDLLSAFDLMYIQVQVDASQFVTLQIGTPSLASSVYTFPISQIQGQGTTPSNNTEVAVVIERSGGGAGVTDHGALTGLADDDHTQYLHKDITRHLTVGYTTDIEADTFTDPLVPDFQLEYFKTMTVTSSFTLNTPTGNSHGEYYLTIDSGGPYTLTAGDNVVMMDSNVTMEKDTNYVLNIHRYSDTNTLAQLTLPGDTSGEKWNAHGNDAVGGGAFSLDDDLSIPTGSQYQINGVDVVARDTIEQLNFGVNNTITAANTEINSNIAVGYGNTSNAPRKSVAIGSLNLVSSNFNTGVGINNAVGQIDGGTNTCFGRANISDNTSVVLGNDNVADGGVIVGEDCITTKVSGFTPVCVGSGCTATSGVSGPAFSMGFDCVASGSNCGALGISINNTVASTFKIGPNDTTAVVIGGNGIGIRVADPLARVHMGPGSQTAPSMIFEESTVLISFPVAGAIEYAPQGGGSDPYIFFTHQDDTRSIINTSHVETTTSASYAIPVEVSTIVCITTNNDVTVTLPTAASSKDRTINVKGFTAGATNDLIVDPDGAETIDKQTTITRTVSPYPSIISFQIISDGTEWWII